MDNKNFKNHGFTLAEILVTLAVIGVVAAMTIPIVMANAKQYEFKTGGKKAFSVMSGAIQNMTRSGLYPENFINASDTEKEEFYKELEKHLSIAKKGTDAEGNNVIYTSDGIAYHFVNTNEYYADINGDKGPSKTTEAKNTWSQADYEVEDDLFESSSWNDVRVSDVFYIGFNPDTGAGVVLPYVQNAPQIAFPNAQTNNKP